MDNSSSLINDGARSREPLIQYTAQAASKLVSGETKLTIGGSALTAAGLFDTVEIPYAEINGLSIADYTVAIDSDSGAFAFSRMGNWCQPFYDALLEAYNNAVLRALFIKSSPALTAKGNYHYTENAASAGGSAPVHVYDNNVTVLPPDLSARRIPLCFVSGMETGDFELTLKLDTGESYTFAKLGYDTVPFADAVAKQIRSLHEKSLAAVRELDPSLTPAQASQLAKLMPQGAAASFMRIADIAPSFVPALEAKLAETRIAEYYAAMKELCDPSAIYVGFRENADACVNSGQTESCDAEPYLLWLIAPSPDGQYAAVEFAEADAATFIYESRGDFGVFVQQLNRALEAISFKREVIRMTGEELRKSENADYYMADKRTAALQFIRSRFTGRLIHSGVGAWTGKLAQAWGIAGR